LRKFRPTLLYSTYSIFQITTTEGSYVEGAAIIKLADLSSWLETQVNVTMLKVFGQSAKLSFTDYPNTDARISFINPEINSDSRLL
jgi:hypothetical protein